MLRQFISVWILYWLAVAALPVYSMYPATTEAFLLQLSFVVIVIFSFLVVDALLSKAGAPVASKVEIPKAKSISRAALLLSVIGFLALAYDKAMIQGIDYTAGVASAREEWRQIGELREGNASSVFSIIGYLLGSSYYVAVVLVITQTSAFSKKQRNTIFLISFLLLLANSAVTGGRSNVLLLGVFAFSAISARKGLRLSNFLTSRFDRVFAAATAVIAFAYTAYIFYERAVSNRAGGIDYALDFLPFLGLEVMPAFESALENDTFGSFLGIVVLLVSYLTHSFAVVAAIIDGPNEDKTIVFIHALDILHKIGIVDSPDGHWFLAGRFPSLPGALYHQFGLVGCVLISVVLGMFAATANFWNVRRSNQLLPLAVYLIFGSILLLSPLLFAGDFLAFPFVVGSFIILAVWSYLPFSSSGSS